MNPDVSTAEHTGPHAPLGAKAEPSRAGAEIPRGVTEETYLAAEAERRREELAQALDVALQRFREAKNLRRWVRRYPWPTVGAAAAAGFTAAAVVTPAKGEKLSEKLSRVASRVPEASGDARGGGDRSGTTAAFASVPFALMHIVQAMFDLARVFVERTAEHPSASRRNGRADVGGGPASHERP
ncbi:MAG: hypothetical protein DCC68_20650 [Planctomycetota bacterium]|nr:MAG: hypothetical protein DCC68_20650 [Planctomycetota bacterium]